MPTPKDKKTKKRKRQRCKASPNTDATNIKKIKQSDIDSESDYFCDAEDRLSNIPPTPHQSYDSEDEFDQSRSPWSLTLSDTKIERSIKTVMDDTLHLFQPLSQSLLDQPPVSFSGQASGSIPGETVHGMPAVPTMDQLTQISHIPCVPQVGQPGAIPFPSGYLQQIQPVDSAHFGLSDSDVMRVALQCKLLITSEIDKLVKGKVDIATAA